MGGQLGRAAELDLVREPHTIPNHWRAAHVFAVISIGWGTIVGCAYSRKVDTTRPADVEEVEVIKRAQVGDLLGKSRRRVLLAELEQQRHAWTQARPTTYTIRVLEISDCVVIRTRGNASTSIQLTVRDTAIVARTPIPLPPDYAQRCPRELRVDDLFNELEHAIGDTVMYIGGGIEYDARYGFPRRYWLTRGHERGAGTLVESFAAAP